MTQAITQSWSAARRRNGTDQVAPDGHDERDEQGLRRERGLTDERDERGTSDEQSQLWQRDDRGGQGLRRESHRRPGGVQRTMTGESDGDRLERSTDWAKPATSTTGDTLVPVLAAWGQIYTSMFELAGDMMKLQQRTFASLMGFADTNAERIASGDQRGRVHDALSASRTSSVVPDQIELHR